MLVLLVRHGHAGTKRQWRRDDRERPLDAQGIAEATALSRVLSPFEPTRLVSSPYLRCLQSITPLAEDCGLDIEETADLVPDAGAAATQLVRALTLDLDGSGAIVLCTHGEVIHEVQTRLAAEENSPCLFGAEALREKGSVWVLDGASGPHWSVRYLPPLSTK
jgi:8-oxo-(d)GTP phosphatase